MQLSLMDAFRGAQASTMKLYMALPWVKRAASVDPGLRNQVEITMIISTRRLSGVGVTASKCVTALMCLALALCTALANATEPSAIDCPLRDAPYSTESPLMDILLNPSAVSIANSHMGGTLDKLPATFASTEAPSFSAIITLQTIASMAQIPKDFLGPVDKELAALPITEADRIARCARYDIDVPVFQIPEGKPRILLFEKMTGFRDGPSVEAATAALKAMAARNGWALVVTDKGGAITPAVLQQFDAVIWNNVSGDVLTLAQRAAFKDYIENGGGYVGIHGSAGDPVYWWDWYADELIGARFIGHPRDPQFQDARIIVEETQSGIGRGLPEKWVLNDEWYSFKTSPRGAGATVIAILDESSYQLVGHGGQDLHMGDHPIAWTRCVGNGRSFYSAIGHRPEIYSEPTYATLLEQGIAWAAGGGATVCRNGAETL